MAVAEFTFCNLTVSHVVSETTTVSEMISVVKQNCPYIPEDLVLFGYTVDGISHVINHDLELRFFIHYCISKGIDVLKLNIQSKICVNSVPSSSYVTPFSSSSSCVLNNEVVVVEDLTDDSSLIKRVPKKLDAWANILIGVGKVFESVKDWRDTVKKYEVQSGYKTFICKSGQKRYNVQCKNKKSENCCWRFHASLVGNTKGVFQCKTYHGEHSCDLARPDPSKVRMTKSFLKDILINDFRASKKKKTAVDVKDMLLLEYSVDLTYSQAYHGLQFTKECLWGDDIKSYSDFVWYKESIERYNPGSVVKFEYDGVTKQFQRFFVAFEASITGFNNYCRPMIFIDWYYQRPLTIISDRGTGLLKHVHVIFLNTHHSYCLYHMKGNIPVPKGKSRQTAVKLFGKCYIALTKEKFYVVAKSMSNLKLDSVIDWMVKISFQNWGAHAFLGERFGENISNIVESFNSVIKHDKRLPSLELIECICAKGMEQNYKRLMESSKWTAKLTPRMQARLNKRVTDCHSYKFRKSSDKVFEIISPTGKHTVDLDVKACTCNWWQKHSFPCTHSMKAMLHIREDEPYKYIILYYTIEYYRGLYARPIYLIPDSERAPKISEDGYMLPPNGGRASAGRPTTARYRGSREKVCTKRKCGQCERLAFHNRRRCRRAPLAPRAPVFRKESNSRMINFLRKMLF
ncbi:uncharacterized protein LOC113336814 [Papaver somniferum]|uniref:uncharacterized protein LOC113336814 n=1 Tax=Papaver somniferum TaxID=3469 RepID=UPI000E6F76F7|nr:uncharacterized protein LOC113336814 [Papaver somniferum]